MSTYQSIWKRYEFDATEAGATNSTGSLVLSDYGENPAPVIYEGTLVANPTTGHLVACVNDIVADYLSAPFVDRLTGRWHRNEALTREFEISVDDDSAIGEVLSYPVFLMDWSYDEDFVAGTTPLPHPIRAEVLDNQWLVGSVLGATSVDAVLTFADGTTQTISVTTQKQADFNADFNEDFAIDADADAVQDGYISLYLGGYSDLESVYVLGTTYKVLPACTSKYVLYYRNLYGGWDSLIVKGAVKRSEGYTRSISSREWDSSTLASRGKENYRTAVQERWSLDLGGWFTDEQAARMRNLIGSNDVYLCDTEADTLIPLIITDSECEDKTWRNQAHKRISYTLQAERAADMERR